MALPIGERFHGHLHVLRVAAEHFLGLRQCLPAMQAFDDERVAAGGQRPGAPVGCHQQRVGVFPVHIRLGTGQRESPRHEGAFGKVEFALHGGVLTAIGQRDQAALLGRLQAVGALEHPVGVFAGGQGVHIQHRGPMR